MNVHYSLENLPDFRNSVVTIGTFDGIHHGHKKLISRVISIAKEQKGESIVITFSPHPREIIYPKDNSLRLLNDLNEKLALLEKLGVDHVVVVKFSIEFSQQTPQEYVEKFLIRNFNPRILVIGYDHKFGLNRSGDIFLLRSYEKTGVFRIVEIEKQELEEITVSSTKIRSFLQNGEIINANKLLGYEYMVTGTVVHGEKIGKTIGFPTANIQLRNAKKLVPKEGVYSVWVYVDDAKYQGMAYIGKRPTIDQNLERKIEVNIFDFDDNIYTKQIKVEVIEFIRPDKKFDNIPALVNQLKIDKQQITEKFEEYYASSSKGETVVAVLNYNGSELMQSFLPVLSDYTSDDIRICVIDNASTDDSVKMLEQWFPEIELVQLSRNYGFAEGYNKGIEQIEAKNIILLNSDVLVTEDWLEPLMKVLQSDSSIAAVMPKIRSLEFKDEFEYAGASGGYMDNLGYPFCRGRIFDTVEKDEQQYETLEEVFWTTGAAMVIKKSVFQSLGGFDSDYFAHQEEIDLCWRIRRAGYKLKVVPSSIVYHMGGASLGYENPKKVYLNFRNNLTTLLKNETRSKMLWLFPMRLILDGIAGLQFLVKGQPKNTGAIIKAHLNVYGRMSTIRAKKKEYDQLIKKFSIGPTNLKGRISGSILFKYFILGKKKYSEL